MSHHPHALYQLASLHRDDLMREAAAVRLAAELSPANEPRNSAPLPRVVDLAAGLVRHQLGETLRYLNEGTAHGYPASR